MEQGGFVDDPKRRMLFGRLVRGLGSQGIASVSNFALVVAIARTSTSGGFGAFAVSYATSQVVVVSMRGVIGETLAVTNPEAMGPRGSPVLGSAVQLGVVVGILAALIGLVWPDPLLGRWLILFAVAMPLMVVQDAARSIGFAAQVPSVAVISDAAWLGFQLVGWSAAAVVGHLDSEVLFGVWVVGCAVGIAWVLPSTGQPALAEGFSWLREHRDLSLSFGLESLISVGASQGTVYAVGFAVGLPAAGALRGAQSLFGPVRAVIAGVGSVALPEAASRHSRSGRKAMTRYTIFVSAGLTMVAATALVLLTLIPEPLGRQLLDETWSGAVRVIPAVGLSLVGATVMTGARLGFRTIHAARELLRLRLGTSALGLILGTGGAVWGGLVPAAYGLSAAHLLTAVLGWLLFTRTGDRTPSDRRPFL